MAGVHEGGRSPRLAVPREEVDPVDMAYTLEPSQEAMLPWKSQTYRQITVTVEGTHEALTFSAARSSTVREVMHVVGLFCQVDPERVILKVKRGAHLSVLRRDEECPSYVYVGGNVKSIERPRAKFEHPVAIIGLGLSGITCLLRFNRLGRTDLVALEKWGDFGGHSWIAVPNKFTKLQTEKSTYGADYMDLAAKVPDKIGGGSVNYSNWPSRDTILLLLREQARAHGIEQYAMFNREVHKVSSCGSGRYAIQHSDAREEDSPADLLVAGAVVALPGFLHELNEVDFPGEDQFGGYIEYSSFDRFDYTRATGKVVLMYGHGAFTIENVRTLCEHRCKKVFVVCRYRNLCGTKMASWLSNSVPALPAVLLLDCFKVMYSLVGYDPWTSPSVTTDAKRTSALINQRTIFGVTDIYFLAGYYGLMEVIVSEMEHLTHHTAHLKSGEKVPCECIVKAIGTKPSFRTSKQMGIKEIVGTWINGDPLRPIALSPKGVYARNFGTFSFGPGIAMNMVLLPWFVDFPQDFELVKDDRAMPRSKDGEWPAFVVGVQYMFPMLVMIQSKLPQLAKAMAEMEKIKMLKSQQTHPLDQYLAQCRAEWDMYIKFFREHNMVDDRPDPPYPYTEEIMQSLLEEHDKMLAAR